MKLCEMYVNFFFAASFRQRSWPSYDGTRPAAGARVGLGEQRQAAGAEPGRILRSPHGRLGLQREQALALGPAALHEGRRRAAPGLRMLDTSQEVSAGSSMSPWAVNA